MDVYQSLSLLVEHACLRVRECVGTLCICAQNKWLAAQLCLHCDDSWYTRFSFVCLLMKRSLDHDWKLSKSEKRWKQSNGDVDEGWSLHSVGFALCV